MHQKSEKTAPPVCISLRAAHGDRCYDVDQVAHINLMSVKPLSHQLSQSDSLGSRYAIPMFYIPHEMSCDAKRSQLQSRCSCTSSQITCGKHTQNCKCGETHAVEAAAVHFAHCRALICCNVKGALCSFGGDILIRTH